jgi:multiple sugar transport system substrate-binding protein
MTHAPIHKRILTGVRIAVITLMGLGALLILAFGPRAGDAFPGDVVVIDYWEKWTGVEEAGMREIVNAFNKTVGREKKIFVRYLSTSSIEQKTLVATAAGVPPDIAGLYNQNIAQFASLGALEPLDNYASAQGITSTTYKPVFWKECSFEGRLYGLVSTGYNIALYYNTEIFKQRADALKARGLDPSRAPRTIAELDAYAQALDEKDSSGRYASTGYIPLEPGWYLQYTCIFFGGRWWDNDAKKFTFTDPKVVEAYHWVQSYSKRLGKQAMADFRSSLGTFDSPQNAFLCGAVAMEQQGTFLANFIHNQRPSMDGKWFAAPFPTNDPNLQNVTYCNCDVLVIPRGAKHKKEAFEFLAFVTQQDQMEKLSKSHCKISPLTKVSEDFLTNHPNPAIRVFDELAAGPNAVATEPIPILAEVNHEMDNFVQRLAVMEITPEEGLKIMQDRLQKKYDDFVASQEARRKK